LAQKHSVVLCETDGEVEQFEITALQESTELVCLDDLGVQTHDVRFAKPSPFVSDAVCYHLLVTMPVPTIFLIDGKNEIIEMKDQPYDSEQLLQELLAQFPTVLAGDQMSGGIPVKWLLVAREAGIPDQEDGPDRWSLDHVFLDQYGVPTLVEVKRSSDTRIRREVVGQMLDYAANAVLYWPVETIRQRFEETCREGGSEPAIRVAEFIGVAGAADGESSIARFWETVETNLRAGKIRLIFAADEIPPELKRVVEFLDEQMNPAEVLAIEIRQYVGTGVRTLVPSVIRSSKRAAAVGGSRMSIQWDRESFLKALDDRGGAEAVAVATRVLEWASQKTVNVLWGRGTRDGSCNLCIGSDLKYHPFVLLTSGKVVIDFQTLQSHAVPAAVIKELASRLIAIPGVQLPADLVNRFPSFGMMLLKGQDPMNRFLEAMWALMEQVKAEDSSVAATTLDSLTNGKG